MKRNLYALILFIGFISCDDIFEQTIAGETVVLISPNDGAIAHTNRQVFRWQAVEGALTYRFQLYTPTFDSSGTLVTDTVIKTTQLAYTLPVGSYQWRVLAQNGSSETAYTQRSFSIDSVSFDQQKIVLVSPNADSVTNQPDIYFTWEYLPGATTYQIQIDSVNFDEMNLLIDDDVLTTAYFFNFQKQGRYQWRVRAKMDNVVSQWSDIYLLQIDQTPPSVVDLQSPANNQMVDKPVTLSWAASSGADYYKLYAYQSDSSTFFNNTFPLRVNGISYDFNVGTANQRVYWRVTAVDKAGNESAYSQYRNFIIRQ